MPVRSKLADAVTGQLDSSLAAEEPVLNFIDGRGYSVGELTHRWDDCVAGKGKSVSEEYLEGSYSVILNLALSQSLEKMRGDQVVADLPSGDARLLSLIVDKNDTVDVLKLRFCDEKPMFIFDIEIVERANEVPVPSRVRLYGFHDAVDDLFGSALCKTTL